MLLDLDECLICSIIDGKSGDEQKIDMMQPERLKDRKRFCTIKFLATLDDGSTDLASLWLIKRPHLDRFLRFAENYFEKIIVWSAAVHDYVHSIVDEIFLDHRYPDLVLTRDDVVYVDEEARDYHKPIEKIMEMHPGLLSPESTIFIDDKQDNFRKNLSNGIVIPRYEPPKNIDPDTKMADSCGEKAFEHDDTHLLNIIDWLMRPEVIAAKDVRKIKKDEIFLREPSQDVFNVPLTTRSNIFSAPLFT